MTIYPFFIHAIFMSIFASVIGPFGGFFASGFKRAFKIKVRFSITSFCNSLAKKCDFDQGCQRVRVWSSTRPQKCGRVQNYGWSTTRSWRSSRLVLLPHPIYSPLTIKYKRISLQHRIRSTSCLFSWRWWAENYCHSTHAPCSFARPNAVLGVLEYEYEFTPKNPSMRFWSRAYSLTTLLPMFHFHSVNNENPRVRENAVVVIPGS